MRRLMVLTLRMEGGAVLFIDGMRRDCYRRKEGAIYLKNIRTDNR